MIGHSAECNLKDVLNHPLKDKRRRQPERNIVVYKALLRSGERQCELIDKETADHCKEGLQRPSVGAFLEDNQRGGNHD